jgi:hypothetical protein
MPANPPPSRNIPALQSDRKTLVDRSRYDFTDYGFVLNASLDVLFEVIPVHATQAEAFFFFYPKDDLASGRYSHYNLHAFLKRTGSLDDFAHSLGASVRTITLEPTDVLGVPAKTYRRQILMKDLFEGAAQVIDFIGGRPDLLVVDSHTYFQHRHNHYYSGMLHEPGNDDKYDLVRQTLFDGIRLT